MKGAFEALGGPVVPQVPSSGQIWCVLTSLADASNLLLGYDLSIELVTGTCITLPVLSIT